MFKLLDATALVKQLDGVATNVTKFCSGVNLAFVCNIRTSSYLWEIGSLLNEVITIVNPTEVAVETVNGITLTAHGESNTRTSSLTLTTSVQLNGQTVMCSESANRAGGVLISSVSVRGECIPSYNLSNL